MFFNSPVAQWLEQKPYKFEIIGSIPIWTTHNVLLAKQTKAMVCKTIIHKFESYTELKFYSCVL